MVDALKRLNRLSSQSLLAAALCLGLSPGALRADSSDATVRAARLTFFQGAVTIDRPDSAESQPAERNLPLLAGVRVSTGDDGQAEIEFEDGSVVRLTPNTALSLDDLSLQPTSGQSSGSTIFVTGLTLLHGLAYAELRALPQYRYTLNAGGDVLSPVENTTVRINFDQPPAVFAVLDGAARIARDITPGLNGYQREVRAGETLQGDIQDPSSYELSQNIAEDSWDQWNETRDQLASAEAATRTGARDNYAGAQGYGWSDLDADGNWYDVPGQGQIWQPDEAQQDDSFDPYANGAWTYYADSGYVFASAYPWGWTPYRCGNWSFHGGFGWGWSPAGGCGGYGWGFAGGGQPVNILAGPGGYRVPRVPPVTPGPHPIRPVRPLTPVNTVAGVPNLPRSMPGGGDNFERSIRRIDGVNVQALQPVGSGFTARGNAPGATLQRDFPVSTTSHTPVIGLQSTQPLLLRTEDGWHSTGIRPQPVNRARPAYGSYENRGDSSARPASGYATPQSQGSYARPQPSQAPRTTYAAPPVQRSAPAPRAAPAPAPAAAAAPSAGRAH